MREKIPRMKGLPKMGYSFVSRGTEISSVEIWPSSLQKAATVRWGPTIIIPSIRAWPPMVVIFFAMGHGFLSWINFKSSGVSVSWGSASRWEQVGREMVTVVPTPSWL